MRRSTDVSVQKAVSCVYVFSHISQEVYHCVGSTHSHELYLVGQQDLHSHENQDFTGAADHLVPNSVEACQHKTGIKNSRSRQTQAVVLSLKYPYSIREYNMPLITSDMSTPDSSIELY